MCPHVSPKDAAQKVTPLTRAVLVAHYAGCPCVRDDFSALAQKHDLQVIEDVAHAPGARYQSAEGSKMLGTLVVDAVRDFFRGPF